MEVSGSAAFSVVAASDLEGLHVAQVATPVRDGAGHTVQYVTDDGHTIAEWFVVDSAQQVVSAPVDGGPGGGMRCLVCHQSMSSGWSVQNCYTKHGKTVFLTLLLDVLLPDGYIGSAIGADAVCDGCAALLNDVDEFSHKLRDTRQLIRSKYKQTVTTGNEGGKAAAPEPSAESREPAGSATGHQVTILGGHWVLEEEDNVGGGVHSTPPTRHSSTEPAEQDTRQSEPQPADGAASVSGESASVSGQSASVSGQSASVSGQSASVSDQPAEASVAGPADSALSCGRCSRQFQHESSLQRHLITCSAVEGACDPGDATEAKLGERLGGEGGDVNDVLLAKRTRFMCDCGESFQVRADLDGHRLERHWDLTRLECRDCVIQLLTPRQYIDHRKEEHNDAKPFCCDLCSKRFTLMSSLKIHRRSHTGVKPFQCELCGKSFSQSTSLHSHKRIHTNQRPHACDVCQRTFREAHALKKHKLIHSGEKPFQCELCEQRFRQKCVLDRHMRTHTGERPYQCDQCEQCFIDSTALRMHKVQHTGQKPYYCEQCGKGFSDSYWFTKHQRYHSGERPFQCDQCPKAFTDARILRTHQKLHAGDRPHICYVCGARFSNSSHLTRHSHIHTGAKPFQCTACPQTFRDRSTLKRHAHTHTQVGRRLYFCADCGGTFPRKEALTAHRRQACSGASVTCSGGASVACSGGASVAVSDALHLAVTAAAAPEYVATTDAAERKAVLQPTLQELQPLQQHQIIQQFQ